MSLETADSVMMMLIKRNTITPTNKGLALMTHADNQSGVLSKSSSRLIRPLFLDYNKLHNTHVNQYRGYHLNVRIDYGRLYHDDYLRNRRLAAVDVISYDGDDLLRIVHRL